MGFLVVFDLVVVHLVEFLAQEVLVFVGEVDFGDLSLYLAIKLLATFVDLVGSMDMAIDEVAYELYLFVA